MERLRKSLNERIYLLSANQISLIHWKFNVRGQSNRIYEQNLKPELYSCSCPDHTTKHTFCKHLLFLLVRVATQMDLAAIITENKKNWNSVVFEICAASWLDRLKNHINTPKTQNTCKAIGSDCSVCFEEMKKDEKIVNCTTTCKNYFHDNCISMWLSTGHDTCPLCRAKWLIQENNDLVVNILQEHIEKEIVEIEQDVEQEKKIKQKAAEDGKKEQLELKSQGIFEENDDYKLTLCNSDNFILYTVDEDMNLSKFEIQNYISKDFKKHIIYYEFIKPEIIPFFKEILLMNKTTNKIYRGDDIKKIAKINCSGYKDNQKKCNPTDIPNYCVFLRSFHGNTKVKKNQKILYEIKYDEEIDD